MKAVIIALLYLSLYASFLGMLTFLIYKDADSWGWFALIGFILLGGLRIKVD